MTGRRKKKARKYKGERVEEKKKKRSHFEDCQDRNAFLFLIPALDL
jgi:hypothetical protein